MQAAPSSTPSAPSASAAVQNLRRFAWLSIAAAVITISLKAIAYLLTDSVSLLSDALESIVNLVAAIVALAVLIVASREPDEEHAYGHSKVEYFSSTFGGLLILVAALSIAVTAIPRLLHPTDLNDVGLGLAVSVIASAVNGAVAWYLFAAARAHRSVTLEANARHLLTDIWTTGGVIVGVIAVVLTGWSRLDPLIALAVAANIVWTGVGLMRRSLHGLMDAALDADDRERIEAVLTRYQAQYPIQAHALRTRQAGARRFMSVHVVVPGGWSVDRGHRLLEAIESDLRAAVDGLTVFTHLESLDDPDSWADTQLDRPASSAGHVASLT